MKKVIFLLLISISAKAQYVAEAPLGAIGKDGFYEIPLPPRVTAMVIPDNYNLRIFDEFGSEVPYVSYFEKPEYRTTEWKDFRMEREIREGCCTIITLFNDKKESINNFLLEVRNAKIYKNGTVRGSDDGKTWYAIREHFQIPLGNFDGKTVLEVLDFPLSDYSYYKVAIDDSTSSPINVVNAWRTSENILSGMFVEVPGISFAQSDSANGRYTWITLHADTSQYIDKIQFELEGPRFYKRQMTMYENGHLSANKRKVWSLKERQSFDLVSGQSPVIHLAAKEKDIYLRVDNQDNPPLKFKSVKAYQLRHSIVAYLQSGHDYKLAIGRDTLDAPHYDLAFFRDSIPANPSEIEVGSLKKYAERKEIKEETSVPYFKDKRLIWAALLVVAALLAGMTARMLREKSQ